MNEIYPPPLIVTTSWDDGSKLDLKLAKLLRKYGINGTFYVTKDYRKDGLTQKEIKILDKYFEIGAHTLNHPDLTSIPLSEARIEIEGSKRYLEGFLDHSVSMFCYPKGRYNDNIKELVKETNFIAARTCNFGNFSQINDPYEWQISLHVSNGSPLTTLKILYNSQISIKSFLDWEYRAKILFNLALEKGGIYHIWGHSWEIEKDNTWEKLETVLKFISFRKGVAYKSNGQIFSELKLKGVEWKI